MVKQQSLASRYKWALILALLLLISLPLQVQQVLSMYSSAAPGHAFVSPEPTQFNVTEPGNYTLWISNEETVDGQLVNYPPDVPSTMAFKLTRDADQAEIPLLPSMNKTVTIRDKKRTGHLVAKLNEAGQYTFTITGSSEGRVFYFGKDFVMKLVGAIFRTACSSLFLFVAMIIAAVYALFKKPTTVIQQDDFTPAERVD